MASIAVNAAILTTSGAIKVLADDDITFDATSSITSTSGNVTVTANADGGAGGMDGALTMAGGATINAGTGTIDLDADENIALSSVTTTTEVQVTTSSGRITDNTAAAEGANITADRTALRAKTGIGLGEAANTADLDLDVSTLAAVTDSGDIHIENDGGLTMELLKHVNSSSLGLKRTR